MPPPPPPGCDEPKNPGLDRVKSNLTSGICKHQKLASQHPRGRVVVSDGAQKSRVSNTDILGYEEHLSTIKDL